MSLIKGTVTTVVALVVAALVAAAILITGFGASIAQACGQLNVPAPSQTIGTAPESGSLFQTIATDAAGDPRLGVVMFMGSHLESDWDPNAVGAGSFGS